MDSRSTDNHSMVSLSTRPKGNSKCSTNKGLPHKADTSMTGAAEVEVVVAFSQDV